MLLVFGNGVSTTITTVVMNQQHASDLQIALVSSAYFIGIAVGSYQCQRFIFRVLHIRAFAAFGTLLVATVVTQGLVFNFYGWMFLRFLVGFCLSGLYIVIESWLLGTSGENNRGTILAIYMVCFYAAQASSQWLLQVPAATPLVIFCMIAIFTALSVIPLAVTRLATPAPEAPEVISFRFLFRRTSLGVIACLVSGLILSVIYTFMPKFMVDAGYESYISNVMFLTILGGTLFQFPVGKLSDIMDRRRVLIAMVITSTVAAALMILFSDKLVWVLCSAFVLGGATFTIYPLSISYSIDFVESHRITSAAAMLFLIYGVGSTVGPVLVVPFTHFAPLNGYFIFIGLVSMSLCAFTIYRMIKLPVIFRSTDNQFVSMPSTTPEAQQLDPRGHDMEQLEFDFAPKHVTHQES